MFSRTEPLNSTASSNTTPTWARSECNVTDGAGAVDADLSRARIVETRQQSGDGRLARTGRADECNGLSRFDAQVHVVQRGRPSP